jgi:hypothetical protein
VVPVRCRGGGRVRLEDTALVRRWCVVGAALVRVWSLGFGGFGGRLEVRRRVYPLSLHIYGTETAFCLLLWVIWESVSQVISGR